jgi:hypothetical protein
MKIPAWIIFPAALFILAACNGYGDSASGEKGEPAKSEKSVRESAKDYLMNPVRQKRIAVKELDKKLGKREMDISRQLDEASQR